LNDTTALADLYSQLNLYLGVIDEADITERIREIIEYEDLKVEEEVLQRIISVASGSMGEAIYALQYYTLSGNLPTIGNDAIDELILASIDHDFVKVAKTIEELMVDQGFTGFEILDMIHSEVRSGRRILDRRPEDIILILADFDMRII
jgi:DNA polymerase III delta prime subunit